MVRELEPRHAERDKTFAAALWLSQLPGLDGRLLQRLLARWETAEQLLRAPSSAWRELGCSAATIARFLAAPRELPRVEESLRGLRRLGISALPIAAESYPERLRYLADPPPVVWVQGSWPPGGPVLLVLEHTPLLDDQAATAQLLASIAGQAAIAAPEARALVDPQIRLVGLATGVLRARGRLPAELLTRVAAGQTTLLSTAAPGAAMSAEAGAASLAALAALADVIVSGGGEVPPHHAALFMVGPSGTLPQGARRLRRGKAGTKALRAALGLHQAGDSTAQQERLF